MPINNKALEFKKNFSSTYDCLPAILDQEIEHRGSTAPKHSAVILNILFNITYRTSYSKETGEYATVSMSLRELSAMTGYDKKAIGDCVKWLDSYSWLEIIRIGKANHYVVNCDKIMALTNRHSESGVYSRATPILKSEVTDDEWGSIITKLRK